MGESVIRTRAPFEKAAELAVETLRAALQERGTARLAVSGGSATQVTGHIRRMLGADWRRVRLTWIDERCVPFADAQSNRGEAHRSGMLSESDPPEVELSLFEDGETPAGASRRVRERLERDFGNRLDVMISGLGEDGHIASLFPNHPVQSAKGRVAFVSDSPKPPPERMTLTFDLLRTATRAIIAFSGEDKRAAFEKTLAGDPAMSANVLPEVTFVTDLDAKGGS